MVGWRRSAAIATEVRMTTSITQHFADLPDPRSVHGRRFSLASLITIAICGVVCGAED